MNQYLGLTNIIDICYDIYEGNASIKWVLPKNIRIEATHLKVYNQNFQVIENTDWSKIYTFPLFDMLNFTLIALKILQKIHDLFLLYSLVFWAQWWMHCPPPYLKIHFLITLSTWFNISDNQLDTNSVTKRCIFIANKRSSRVYQF